MNAAAGERCDDGGQLEYRSGLPSSSCPANWQNASRPARLFMRRARRPLRSVTPRTVGRYRRRLARLKDSAEDQALRAHATSSGVSEYWAGATDLDAEGQWMWLDATRFWSGAANGKALAYSHFAAASPGGGNAANCLRVLSSGEWKDTDCTATTAYLCEIHRVHLGRLDAARHIASPAGSGSSHENPASDHHLSVEPDDSWAPDPIAPGAGHLGLYLRSIEHGASSGTYASRSTGGVTLSPRTVFSRFFANRVGARRSMNGTRRPAASSSSAVRSKRSEWAARSCSRCS